MGPALAAVELDDIEGLRALFAEQRARLAVVRENRIWQWFGGVPSGFGSPKALLHGLYLQFAFIALLPIALIVAGITRGPGLWVILALGASCLLVRSVVLGRPTRKTLRFYRRAVQAPAMVIATAPCSDPALAHLLRATALVAFGAVDGGRLAVLVSAAERLGRMIEGAEPIPDDLAPLVANVRDAMAERVADGSRFEVPASLGVGHCELAYVLVPVPLLPEERFSSRLVFVLCDPTSRAAAHTRIVQSSLWGNGVEKLCDAFPMQVSA